jgi:excisionase family DNA binding protein
MSIEESLRKIIQEELASVKQDILLELRRSQVAAPIAMYLTTEEAAEIARVTPATVREWIKTGALRERRSGQRLLVSASELHAYLAGELLPDEDLVVERELQLLGLG